MFEIEQIIYVKLDLALKNLQRLICHKNPTNQPTHNLFNPRVIRFELPKSILFTSVK